MPFLHHFLLGSSSSSTHHHKSGNSGSSSGASGSCHGLRDQLRDLGHKMDLVLSSSDCRSSGEMDSEEDEDYLDELPTHSFG